jgi:hypothetical protein
LKRKLTLCFSRALRADGKHRPDFLKDEIHCISEPVALRVAASCVET